MFEGHSRKLQRDLILRPDEGASLEESDDEDNPETIKTIREQFRKMDNNSTPFVPQAPQPQVSIETCCAQPNVTKQATQILDG